MGESVTNPYNNGSFPLNFNLITKVTTGGEVTWSEPIFYSNGVLIENFKKNYLDINAQGDIYVPDSWGGKGNYRGNVIENFSSLALTLLKTDINGNFKLFKSFGSVAEGFNLDLSNDDHVTISAITYERMLDDQPINHLRGQNFMITKLEEETLATSENIKTTISVYPNPTSDILYISSNYEVSAIQLYDSSGTMIFERKKNAKSVNISQLPIGVYYLRAFTSEGILTSKVIKK